MCSLCQEVERQGNEVRYEIAKSLLKSGMSTEEVAKHSNLPDIVVSIFVMDLAANM